MFHTKKAPFTNRTVEKTALKLQINSAHIHCLISEGGFSDDGFWRKMDHFNYTYLRNSFRTALLNELEAKNGPSFKKVKANLQTCSLFGVIAGVELN
jgi:hypothetical protein